MRLARCLTGSLALISLLMLPASAQDIRRFDEFGKINCEDEMARLDNLAITLQNDFKLIAYIYAYGGQGDRRGEARMRLIRAKNYMVKNRGLAADRIVTRNGGYRDDLTVEIYVIPRGIEPPILTPTVDAKEIRFRRGKMKRWEYRCQI